MPFLKRVRQSCPTLLTHAAASNGSARNPQPHLPPHRSLAPPRRGPSSFPTLAVPSRVTLLTSAPCAPHISKLRRHVLLQHSLLAGKRRYGLHAPKPEENLRSCYNTNSEAVPPLPPPAPPPDFAAAIFYASRTANWQLVCLRVLRRG